MKIGIMSFAHHHAEAYLANLCTMPGVEVIGVADEDLRRAEMNARQYEVPLFDSYEALLAEKPDGVAICPENSKHRPLVEMAAAAGAGILCEKPLATTVEDARAIVDVCRDAGVTLMTAFPMRFSSPLLEVKNSLDAGALGEPYCFNSSNQGELPDTHRAWFVDKELAGGGAVADHTVHLVDVMRWYLESEVHEVYAQTTHIYHADKVDIETGGMVCVTFENGVFATIDCSWSRPPYWPTWGGLSFEMVTSRGSVMVDGFKQMLTVYSHKVERPNWSFWGSDANRGMLFEFVDALKEKREASVTGVDGLRAVEVVQAAYESARCGQPVPVKHV